MCGSFTHTQRERERGQKRNLCCMHMCTRLQLYCRRVLRGHPGCNSVALIEAKTARPSILMSLAANTPMPAPGTPLRWSTTPSCAASMLTAVWEARSRSSRSAVVSVGLVVSVVAVVFGCRFLCLVGVVVAFVSLRFSFGGLWDRVCMAGGLLGEEEEEEEEDAGEVEDEQAEDEGVCVEGCVETAAAAVSTPVRSSIAMAIRSCDEASAEFSVT